MGLGSIIGNVLGGAASGATTAPALAVESVANLAKRVLDSVIPDPAARAAAQLEFEKLDLQRLAQETDLWKGQGAIGLAEAQSQDPFTSRWRPFIGWVCGLALACYFVPRGVVSTGIWVVAVEHAGWQLVPFPDMGIGDLMTLTMNLLGLGFLRSVDKKNGVAS